MNLVVDQGNTRVKLGFFNNENVMVEHVVASSLDVPFLMPYMKRFKPDCGIVSSVSELNPEVMDFLHSQLVKCHIFNHKTPIPLKNAYQTPHSLGLDRIAAAVGAWTLKPGRPLLIVDMGTAITYDVVDSNGIFLGGNIAPGMHMRFNSLHHFTKKLPLVQPNSNFLKLGVDTDSAICAGVMQGIVLETDAYCELFQQQFPGLFAFLTGGDAIYFVDKLKSSIFVHENLVLLGLNRILCFHDPA